jgi:hypothetical protein
MYAIFSTDFISLHQRAIREKIMNKVDRAVFYQRSFLKEEHLAKSNQVLTTIEAKISDCRPKIEETVLHCCTDLI